MRGNEMTEITDGTREWVSSIAGKPVTDEEIIEFLNDLDDYEESNYFLPQSNIRE